METFERNDNGYRFHSKQEIPLYNPTRAIYNLSKIQEILRLDDNVKQTASEILKNINVDFNTKPAESTLNMIENSPLFNQIIMNIPTKELPIKCPDGLLSMFRLTDLLSIENIQSLISFMYYTGALTYNIKSNPRNKYEYFNVPNELAFNEYILKLQEHFKLDKTVVKLLKDSIMNLWDNNVIKPFCDVLSNVVFKNDRNRDVLDGENVLYSVYYCMLLVCQDSNDTVMREKLTVVNEKEKYQDIVYYHKDECYVFKLNTFNITDLEEYHKNINKMEENDVMNLKLNYDKITIGQKLEIIAEKYKNEKCLFLLN